MTHEKTYPLKRFDFMSHEYAFMSHEYAFMSHEYAFMSHEYIFMSHEIARILTTRFHGHEISMKLMFGGI